MNIFINNKINILSYKNVKYNLPKCGSFIVCAHYWFEYKISKVQYFIGRCFKVRRKGILSSTMLRTFCYKTTMEILLFLNSPTLIFLYSFMRDYFYKRMSVIFLRKTRKFGLSKNTR